MSLREQIAELLEQGIPKREIAVRLGTAGPTVDYHAGRLALDETPVDASAEEFPPAEAAVTQVSTRVAVHRLLDAGASRAAIARTLGLSKSTVSYHARRLGMPVDERGARRYDWSAVQAYYDAGHSKRECQAHFGFSSETWHSAMKRGALVTRPPAMSIDELCQRGVPRNRFHIRGRLVAAGLKEERCEECGLAEWRGQPIPLSLHHVNGDRHDNRVENLQLLCGNCHGLTENFAGRKRPQAA